MRNRFNFTSFEFSEIEPRIKQGMQEDAIAEVKNALRANEGTDIRPKVTDKVTGLRASPYAL